MTEIIYTPGVCNIGPEEIAMRNRVGWIGTVLTVILTAALLVLQVPYLWRILVFIPAFIAAAGFVQAYTRFCVGFAKKGVSNFGPTGKQEAVLDEAARARDTKRAAVLYTYITLIALVVTLVILFI